MLDSAENFDADTIEGSNDMYEFAGASSLSCSIHPRVLSCVCTACRNKTSVHTEYKDCKYLATCVASGGSGPQPRKRASRRRRTRRRLALIAKEQLCKSALYRDRPAVCRLQQLCGERWAGGRPYWLLKVTKPAYKSRTKKKQDGVTYKAGTWLVEGQWYLSTSDDQQRRSYELLKETVIVPVDVIVQEVGLQFKRAGLHERILTDVSHVAIMSWNFSNVQGAQR